MSKQRLIFSFKKEYRPSYLAIPKIDFGSECICCNKRTPGTFGFQTYGGSGSTYTPEPIQAPLCRDCHDHVHPDHISFFIALGMVLSMFIGLSAFIGGIVSLSGSSMIIGSGFLFIFVFMYWHFYMKPIHRAEEGHFPLTRFIVYQNTFGVVSRNKQLINRLQDLNVRKDLEVKIKEAVW